MSHVVPVPLGYACDQLKRILLQHWTTRKWEFTTNKYDRKQRILLTLFKNMLTSTFMPTLFFWSMTRPVARVPHSLANPYAKWPLSLWVCILSTFSKFARPAQHEAVKNNAFPFWGLAPSTSPAGLAVWLRVWWRHWTGSLNRVAASICIFIEHVYAHCANITSRHAQYTYNHRIMSW